MRYLLSCTSCDVELDSRSKAFRCDKCGDLLEVVYDYSTLKMPPGFRKRRITQSKYQAFFPAKLFSLNEGGTRLFKAKRIDGMVGGAALYLKMESENPTRSFKDRGSSVELGKALELGVESVCCASTGNMGLSIATYAKRAKIGCTIFISRSANAEKIRKIRKTGATVDEVRGDFNAAIRKAEKFALDSGAFLCGDYHYRKEGQKGVAFELIEQFRYNVPDYIFVPVGNGTLMAAMYKGLREFKQLGFIDRYPALVAVQSGGCDPLVKAYTSDSALDYVRPRTYADAIAVGYPTFGFECLAAIRETSGNAVAVSDKEIEEARKTLRVREGVDAEPGGATSLAGFFKLARKMKGVFKGRRVAVIVSGNNEER